MTYCSNCGHPSGADAFCSNCGASLGVVPSRPPVTVGPAQRSSTAVAIAGVVAAAVVVVVALGVTAMLVLNDDEGSGPSSPETVAAPPPTSTTPSATPSADPTPSRTTRPAANRPRASRPGDVRDLRSGLFCRDLVARGYSYVAAVDYWRANGQPNQMDEDRNGIPCQTVYTPLDVSAYWGVNTVPQQVVDTAIGLPAGLFCRDLFAGGYSYSDAVNYWFYSGQPDQMDADVNGIPCETVYPSSLVNDYWY